MPAVYGAIDLQRNELRNAVVQNLASAPSTPAKGQLYFNSTGGDNVLYWYNGTGWVAAQGGAGAVPSTTVTTAAIGDAAVVGVATTYAREDHKHGMPSFGAATAQTSFGAASGNGSAATLARSDHTHGTPTHDAAAHSTISLSALAVPTASLNLNSQKITGLADGTAATDAASYGQLQNSVAGLSWKTAVRAGTTANITLSAPQTIDGVAVIANDRVLVKNQTTTSANGIYTVAAGAWVRATDADSATELVNATVFVSEGTTLADTSWTQTVNAPITVGTTGLTFAQFGGGSTITDGAGLLFSGNVLNIGQGTGIIVGADSISIDDTVIATDAQVTSAIATAVTGMAKKYAAALTGTASPETVTHNLGTRDIQLTVLNGATPYTAVEVDWDATTTNTAVIRYSPTLGAGYRVVVVG